MTTSVSVFEPHTHQQPYQRQPLFCVGSPDVHPHEHSHLQQESHRQHPHPHEHEHSHSHSHSHGHSHAHPHEHEHVPDVCTINARHGGRSGSLSSETDADADYVEEAGEGLGADHLDERSPLLGAAADSQRRSRRALRRRGYSYCSNFFTQRFAFRYVLEWYSILIAQSFPDLPSANEIALCALRVALSALI